MSRLRGSATALKASDVVAALAIDELYIPIWEYVKRYFHDETRGRTGAFEVMAGGNSEHHYTRFSMKIVGLRCGAPLNKQDLLGNFVCDRRSGRIRRRV
jgi:hypothetical protein